ncbi:hypothetical protein LJB75_01225 [Bacteroidales bacterium OttesenSCG-928-L19]|nr:hypothetical protein [Bacteroidales bacterium OttesenSCG-928-L19]
MIWRGTIDTSDTLYRCRLGVRSFSDNKCKLKAASRCGYWESDFEDIPYIQFLIVNDSIYRNIPCDTIRKYNMVLHRYQLTLEDLQRMNWVVNYPPE